MDSEQLQQILKIVIPIAVAVLVIALIFIIAIPISKKTGQKYIKVVANLFWVILIGWEMAVVFFLLGVVCCVTLIFIPIGLQYFKFAKLAIWPFGFKPTFTKVNGFKMFVNIVWLIFGGWENAVVLYILGGICFITIILMPCAYQLWKFARLLLMPLGTTIEKIEE